MKLAKLIGIALGVLLLATACSSYDITTTPESYKLSGQRVSFCPPPATWTKYTQELPRRSAPANTATDTVLRFSPGWPDGHITITALGNWEVSSWEENPEKTKELVRTLQDQILKRDNAKITKQSETKLAGITALRLDFTYKEGPSAVMGSQVYAVRNKTFWSLSMLAPEVNYKEGLAVFDNLVDTFKFE